MSANTTSQKDSRNNKGKDTKLSHILKVASRINHFSVDTIEKLAKRIESTPIELAESIAKARLEGVCHE